MNCVLFKTFICLWVDVKDSLSVQLFVHVFFVIHVLLFVFPSSSVFSLLPTCVHLFPVYALIKCFYFLAVSLFQCEALLCVFVLLNILLFFFWSANPVFRPIPVFPLNKNYPSVLLLPFSFNLQLGLLWQLWLVTSLASYLNYLLLHVLYKNFIIYF